MKVRTEVKVGGQNMTSETGRMRSENPRTDIGRRDFLKGASSAVITTSVGGWGLLGSSPAHAAGPVLQRPISDFVDAQGRVSFFVPPIKDFIGWFSAFNKPPVLLASVDYAGI